MSTKNAVESGVYHPASRLFMMKGGQVLITTGIVFPRIVYCYADGTLGCIFPGGDAKDLICTAGMVFGFEKGTSVEVDSGSFCWV